MAIQYLENSCNDQEQITALYDNVKWTAYTDDVPKLMQAIAHSLTVITAWDNNHLVGLIRVVGDGYTIIYIQDILVNEAYQNQGVGSALMQRVLDKYRDVRQKVLLTIDEPGVRAFYEKHGFKSCDKSSLVAFAKLHA